MSNWTVEVITQRGKRHSYPAHTREAARKAVTAHKRVPFVKSATVVKSA